ncbi:MAG TPA: HAD-IC family P-type ATPase [Anaerolineae bacterium]
MAELVGLSESEVRVRRARGQGNNIRLASSRSYRDILTANLFDPLNLLLVAIGAVQISIGRWGDAAAGVGIALFNVVVAMIQEVRAKRQLDRIALLTRPKVAVLRDRTEARIDPAELVQGDLVVVRPGDQVVVDGVLASDDEIEVDESLLTGESNHVSKHKGDQLLSGSFCVTGQAMYEATQVGEHSYANRLTRQARQFHLARTPLQREIYLVLRWLSLLVIFLGGVELLGGLVSELPLMRMVQGAAVIAGLIPAGLISMVVVSYAMGAVRMARGGALVQQANAIESLSHVTVLCTDKTGTLTTHQSVLDRLCPLSLSEPEIKSLLADYAASVHASNPTTDALRAALPGTVQPKVDEVPFSSARKWSALAFRDGLSGVYVLGAAEMLRDRLTLSAEATDRLREWEDAGRRVLVFARNVDCFTLHDFQPVGLNSGEPVLPPLQAIGLVALREELRPHVQETLAAFQSQGIALKIISGDNPNTVAALAKQAGFAQELRGISGPELAAMDAAAYAQAARDHNIFGRIAPEQKEKLVEALVQDGQYVAMIGDGVNDVLSLKKANVGIAMESGSSATRAVADMVLLGDSFAALPHAFREGQRIVAGMKDVLRLYLTRILYMALLIIGVSIVGLGFPFLPKQSGLFVLLTVGLPAFCLAWWARPGPVTRKGVLPQIAHFVFPAAIAVFSFGLFVYIGAFYASITSLVQFDVTPEAIAGLQKLGGITYDISTPSQFILEASQLVAQTSLTAFLVFAGLGLVVFAAPPVEWFVGGEELSGDGRPALLAAALLLVFIAIDGSPPLRSVFEMMALPPLWYTLIAVVALACLLLLRAAWRGRWLERFLEIEI